jgi:hypothetical protein
VCCRRRRSLLFRLFDIWKPYPIRELERRVKGGMGVMIDDVVAAVLRLHRVLVFVIVVYKGLGSHEDLALSALFAHRGGGRSRRRTRSPRSQLGQSLGYRAHEFDVKLSKDDVAMLLHDDTLERTTTGRGAAADFTGELGARRRRVAFEPFAASGCARSRSARSCSLEAAHGERGDQAHAGLRARDRPRVARARRSCGRRARCRRCFRRFVRGA